MPPTLHRFVGANPLLLAAMMAGCRAPTTAAAPPATESTVRVPSSTAEPGAFLVIFEAASVIAPVDPAAPVLTRRGVWAQQSDASGTRVGMLFGAAFSATRDASAALPPCASRREDGACFADDGECVQGSMVADGGPHPQWSAASSSRSCRCWMVPSISLEVHDHDGDDDDDDDDADDDSVTEDSTDDCTDSPLVDDEIGAPLFTLGVVAGVVHRATLLDERTEGAFKDDAVANADIAIVPTENRPAAPAADTPAVDWDGERTTDTTCPIPEGMAEYQGHQWRRGRLLAVEAMTPVDRQVPPASGGVDFQMCARVVPADARACPSPEDPCGDATAFRSVDVRTADDFWIGADSRWALIAEGSTFSVVGPSERVRSFEAPPDDALLGVQYIADARALTAIEWRPPARIGVRWPQTTVPVLPDDSTVSQWLAACREHTVADRLQDAEHACFAGLRRAFGPPDRAALLSALANIETRRGAHARAVAYWERSWALASNETTRAELDRARARRDAQTLRP